MPHPKAQIQLVATRLYPKTGSSGSHARDSRKSLPRDSGSMVTSVRGNTDVVCRRGVTRPKRASRGSTKARGERDGKKAWGVSPTNVYRAVGFATA
jgi:hypothetical protein